MTTIQSRLLALAAGIMAFAVAIAAAAQPEISGARVDRYLYVSMSDGVDIATTLLRPAVGTAFPTVVVFQPYGETLANPWFRPAPALVRNGYAVLVVDWRGSGCSGGTMDLGSERFHRDGSEVIEWASEQPWSTGRVGLAGSSARAVAQWPIAAMRPPALKAISPFMFESDFYRDLHHRGGVPHYLSMIGWSLIEQPRASARVLEQADGRCLENRRQHDPVQPMEGFHILSQHHDQARYRRTAARHYVRDTEVPALMLLATHDRWAPAWGMDFIDLAHPQSKLIVTNGGHGLSAMPAAEERLVEWFDHWLKGSSERALTRPRVTVLYETDAAMEPGFERGYEEVATPSQDAKLLYLNPEGRLAANPPDRYGSLTYQFGPDNGGSGPLPEPNTGFDFSAGWKSMPEAGLIYRSAPVVDNLLLFGRWSLHLEATLSVPDADLIAFVAEEDAYGNVTYLHRGLFRASHHGAEPAHSRSTPLEPGRHYRFTIELFPIAHALRAGSRLMLHLVPAWVLSTHLGFDVIPTPYEGTITVHHGAGAQSMLRLPVVERSLDLPPPPACGSLAGQPCRAGKAAAVPSRKEIKGR